MSPDQFREAIVGLSAADQARLSTAAHIYGRRHRSEPEDLYQEALVKALSGERRCPVGTNPVVFLSNAMRSIAFNWRPSHQLESLESAGDLATDEHVESVLAALLESALRHAFADDRIARAVLDGILEGLRGQALCDETGLDRTQLATARRRIRRWVLRYSGESRLIGPLTPGRGAMDRRIAARPIDAAGRKARRSFGEPDEPELVPAAGFKASPDPAVPAPGGKLRLERGVRRTPYWETPRRLENLLDALVEDVLGLSDEDVLAERDLLREPAPAPRPVRILRRWARWLARRLRPR